MRTLLLCAAWVALAEAQTGTVPAPPPTPAIASRTASLRKLSGYFPLYWDEKAGKLWLEIDKFDTEFLYVNSLPAGVGSNDIGLDRGQIGDSRVVKFQRSGPKILLTEPNYRFRAIGGTADEKRAVEESFAQSVLWGFEVQAEEDGRVLVDATAFFMRDAHNVPQAIQQARPVGGTAQLTGSAGGYRLDAARSAFYLPQTKNFPKNTEVETILTFGGDSPNQFVRDVTPSPESVTVREHHSLIELPGAGYEPRAFDPRAGYFGTSYADYATPLSEPIQKRWINRHRLQKKDPGAVTGEAAKPIVYYLDRGVPEPIRSALLEGARWWSQAFEAAGFKDAFRVELLPEGADPMDIRYNLIQWVHRFTRGWSYGESITDPRTGEIIKGQVSLGSLRVRQDYLIMEGVLAPYEEGKPLSPEMERVALARLRQLAAHEVGHTLGLAHNYAASVKDRSSVMDYPPPVIVIAGAGAPDLSKAYATGIGEWDKAAIEYGYREFPKGAEERKQLDALLRRETARGFLFLSDSDARPEGSASPVAHLWDSGSNAVDELNRMLEVRARVLSRFSANNIREGEPMSRLEDVLVPVYLLHRYQTEAAAKVLGGVSYTYALRGDGQKVLERVPGAEQRRALDALLRTIRPEALTLPANILALIPPTAYGYARSRENFRNRTGLTFDPVGAAESAANLSVGLLLNPERAARLVQYHAEESSQPGLDEVADRLLAATWRARPEAGLAGQVQRAVDSVVLYHLMVLARNDRASVQARATALAKLVSLREWLAAQAPADAGLRAFYRFGTAQIKRFETDPEQIPVPRPPDPPPGQPIGADDCLFFSN
jgi:hypothetical protein